MYFKAIKHSIIDSSRHTSKGLNADVITQYIIRMKYQCHSNLFELAQITLFPVIIYIGQIDASSAILLVYTCLYVLAGQNAF